MRPVQTDNTNIILTATIMQCSGGQQEIETCWELDPEELAAVQRTRKIYLIVVGRVHPPVILGVESRCGA